VISLSNASTERIRRTSRGSNSSSRSPVRKGCCHSQDIALCGIILTEILQGIANDTTHRRVRRYLAPLILLPMPEAVFVRAADIYRRLRKQGTTIRKTNDCIIAATVLEHHCRLLHNDKDFAPIARDYPLKVVKTGPL
jgi:predicted nucleic acid-binding protein